VTNDLADAFAEALAGATTVRLSDVEPEKVNWLWPARLPAGKLVILDGDPGVGKSTLAVDIAARVSTGRGWPDGGTCPTGAVLILSAEDGLADTIRPRLDAAAGDPTRVHALTEIRYVGEDGQLRARPPTLSDVDELEEAIRRTGALLVVVDVLMAFLPGGVDSHRDSDVRSVLHRLAALAERTGCVILLLRHLNKSSGGSPLYRGGGSIAFIGAARSALLAAVDPEDDSRRVLAVTKANLSAMPPALGYRLVDSAENGCARVDWLGPTGHSAGDLLRRVDDDDETAGPRDQAVDWLGEVLADGPLPAREVKALARSAGISDRTLDRARQRAQIVTERSGFGRGSTYVWRATGAPCSPPEPHARHVRQLSEGGVHGVHGDDVAHMAPSPAADDNPAPPPPVTVCSHCGEPLGPQPDEIETKYGMHLACSASIVEAVSRGGFGALTVEGDAKVTKIAAPEDLSPSSPSGVSCHLREGDGTAAGIPGPAPTAKAAGPCAGCGAGTARYGPGGSPLCADCGAKS